MPFTPVPLDLRLWPRIDRNGPNGCWIWTGGRFSTGYGAIAINRQNALVHRVVWKALVGPIPDGMQIDHLCRVRECCNPEHLEVVDCRTNLLRGNTLAAENARKTHCKHGHEFTEANTMRRSNGHRVCRECSYAAWRKAHPPKGTKKGPPLASHCNRGHPLSGGNLYVSPKGKRVCRACAKIRANR